jgi:hypothetical protein
MGVRAKVKQASPKLLNTWLLFVTTAILAIVFIFYQFVYVKNNEKAQVSKRFRVLSKIGENISAREKALRKVVENGVQEALEKWDPDFTDNTLPEIVEKETKNANKILHTAPEKYVRGTRFIPFCTFGPKDDDSDYAGEYVIYAGSNDFFDPLNRSDIFDGLIVLQEKTKQEGSGESLGGTTVLYYTYPGDIDIPGIEGLRSKENVMEAGSLTDVRISNKSYKLFLQPIILESGNKWYVGGLVKRSRFNGEIRGLKSDVVILFLIVFCIFILAIPLLKLFLMSTFDQLNVNDVLLAVSSITLGMLLLVLFYLFSYQKAGDTAGIDHHLKNLALKIEDEFTGELGRALEQLETYDSKDPQEYGFRPDDTVINVLSREKIDSSPLLRDRLEEIIPQKYRLFKVVSWLDSTGMQQLEFSTRKNFGLLVNVGHRRYFQDAGNWKFPGNSEMRFMLESITSITSGEKIAAISKKSGSQLKDMFEDRVKLDAVAMTARLTSVIDTIMPAGYGFCITDQSGDTWFHSDKERNKEENFIDETGSDSELLSAIQAAHSRHIALDYQNKSHRSYILPLKNIPLFIVTFHDMRYTRSVHVHTVFYAVCFAVLLLLFNGLLFFAAAYCDYRMSPLQLRFIPFDRLRPGMGKDKIYRHLIYANLLAAVLLIVSKLWSGSAETLFLCLSAALFIFAYNYYTAGRDEKKTCIPFNRRGAIAPVLLFIIINVAALFLADRFMAVLLFQVVLAAGLWLLHRLEKKLDTKKDGKTANIKSLEKRYAGFLLSWLTAVCAVPFIMIFIDAYNLENETALKFLQVNLARDIEKRNLDIDTFYKEKMVNPRQDPIVEETRRARKDQGIYAGIIKNTHKTEGRTPPPFTALRRFDRAAYYFRLPFTSLGEEKRNLVFSRASNYSRVWWKEKDRLFLQYEIEKSLPDSPDGDKLYIESTMKYFPVPTGFSLLLAVLAAFLVCWLTYSLIRYTTRRVFGLNVLEVTEPPDFLAQIREALHSGGHLVIYCQTRERVDYIHDLAKNKFMPQQDPSGDSGDLYIPVSVKNFDLMEDADKVEKVAAGRIKRVLVKNFDLNENDFAGNKNKIETLISLLRIPGIQVLLPSPVPLANVMEWYEEKQAATDDEKNDYRKISDLLSEAHGQMVPVYTPLKNSVQSAETADSGETYKTIEEEIDSPRLKQLILEEFAPSDYFKNIEECTALYYDRLITKQKAGLNQNIEDKIIHKIRELSRHYYEQLLRSCTRRETLVLYDIARDTLINVNNLETIEVLLKKGLLVYDGTFRLMNESFRSHILMSIDASEAGQLMTELRTRSKWKSYKAPFFLILLGLAVFFAFQGNLLSEINALMTAVIGTLAIVSKFSGILSKGGDSPGS